MEKKPANSLLYLKMLYESDKESTLKKYFNDEYITKLDYYKKNNPDENEFKYLWSLVKENVNIKNKIIIDFRNEFTDDKILTNKKDEEEISESIIQKDENVFKIQTFNEYSKYSYSCQFIITKPKNKEGYVKYKNWMEISESIIDILKRRSFKYIYIHENNIITKETWINIVDRNYANLYKKYKLEYDYELIEKDIIKNFYEKKPELFEPKYNEYIVNLEKSSVIFDMKLCNFYTLNKIYKNTNNDLWNFNLTDISKNKINNINDRIISLIGDNLISFKLFCRNIFIERNNNIYQTGPSLLANLLRKTSNILNKDMLYDIENLKKQNNKRYAILNEIDDKNIEKTKKIVRNSTEIIYIINSNSDNIEITPDIITSFIFWIAQE